MEWRKPLSSSIVQLIVSLGAFMLLLGLVGLLARNVEHEVFQQVVAFIDANVWLMVAIIVLYFFVDLLRGLGFPAAWGLPLASALGASALAVLVLRALAFTDRLLGVGFSGAIGRLVYPAAALTLLVVLLWGYLPMLRERRRHELYSRQV